MYVSQDYDVKYKPGVFHQSVDASVQFSSVELSVDLGVITLARTLGFIPFCTISHLLCALVCSSLHFANKFVCISIKKNK